jgi:hypothetical protein
MVMVARDGIEPPTPAVSFARCLSDWSRNDNEVLGGYVHRHQGTSANLPQTAA